MLFYRSLQLSSLVMFCLQPFGASPVPGAMSYCADDPEAMEALLYEWGAPPSVLQALVDSGFTTLGSLTFAVASSSANAQETCILNVLGLDPADPSALMLPDAACLRRLLAVACSLQLPGLSSAASASSSAPAASGGSILAPYVPATLSLCSGRSRLHFLSGLPDLDSGLRPDCISISVCPDCLDQTSAFGQRKQKRRRAL